MVVNQKYLYIKEFIYIWNTTYIHLSLQTETRKNKSFHWYKGRGQVREREEMPIVMPFYIKRKNPASGFGWQIVVKMPSGKSGKILLFFFF